MKTPWRNIFSISLAGWLGAALFSPAPSLAGDKILINGKQKGNSPAEAGQTITLKREERASAEFTKAMANYTPNPEMVAIPADSFRMGCQGNDKDCSDDEKPAHEVSLSAFAIGKYEVTFEMWDACYVQGGCDKSPDDKGWGRGTRPVINVSWDDIQKFLVWINAKTGKSYRLPTEVEWEYAALVRRDGHKVEYGTETGELSRKLANYGTESCCSGDSSDGYGYTAPVGSYPANDRGLHDMSGNVWEWMQDCLDSSYAGASSEGTAREKKCEGSLRVIRGGSWNSNPSYMRAAGRHNFSLAHAASDYLGFRLVLPSSASQTK
jgi:formylglycine-generating enzyme required for sulfatase activity